MEDNFANLKDYIKILESYKLPDYKELSTIPLYMEQVVSYIQGVLEPIENDKTIITPFMINNYVKAKILNILVLPEALAPYIAAVFKILRSLYIT